MTNEYIWPQLILKYLEHIYFRYLDIFIIDIPKYIFIIQQMSDLVNK